MDEKCETCGGDGALQKRPYPVPSFGETASSTKVFVKHSISKLTCPTCKGTGKQKKEAEYGRHED